MSEGKMLDRQAILIANSVSYSERDKNVPVGVVQSIAQDLGEQLDHLGDYSFKVATIVNKRTEECRRMLLEAIRRAGKNGSLLLLYYFGHGVKSQSDELFLYFKDSDWLDLPTMLNFHSIVELLTHYNVPKVIVILDCCYAGMVTKNLRILDMYGGRYYLMASVTPKEKAKIDYSDERPIGLFTKFLLDGFSNPGAREPVSREVSFRSLLGFADQMTRKRSSQLPYSVDGGIAGEIFFKQEIAPVIPTGVRNYVQKKSSYHKLFVLGSYLLAKHFQTADSFYNFLKKRNPKEFLTPIKVGPRTVEYDFIGRESFQRYLNLLSLLGALEKGNPLTLTADGKRMVRTNGRFYNVGLFKAVEKVWQRYGIKIVDFEDVIGMRMRNNRLPSKEGIYVDMYLSKKISMKRDLFNILLDLTGYVGALKYSIERTFFLPLSEER